MLFVLNIHMPKEEISITLTAVLKVINDSALFFTHNTAQNDFSYFVSSSFFLYLRVEKELSFNSRHEKMSFLFNNKRKTFSVIFFSISYFTYIFLTHSAVRPSTHDEMKRINSCEAKKRQKYNTDNKISRLSRN